ncbi:hypothetical protein [Bdellovibrio svalbardensis]|uniref:Uncharacterized protein n=1 Tax=Bdellovibrio svalbardensis TaxID=2972972 RepID=A0ABT6DJT5_9BACT|nr:hypothetical protein [Bdellovibrio svalbardensis]MDG0817135.1 hypothetical protein [Bdellovibrio svalbardensis]
MNVSFFKHILWTLILASSVNAWAWPWSRAPKTETYLYQPEFQRMGQSYLDLLDGFPTDKLSSLPADQKAACVDRYSGILKDGVIDIRLALGYFDWTTGTPVGNYGLSPSMDLGAYAALKDVLTNSCTGSLRICGFKQDPKNPYIFTREVVVFGQKYRARVEMHFSSATEYYSSNVGKYANDQRERTQFMDNFFASALQNADATFYFGHSRNGGGPDFSPPRLTSKNKVDYDGYYEVVRPGFKKMLSALSNGSSQTKIFGLMSCDSRDHFLGKLRGAAPKTGVITSTAVLNVDEVYTAMIGAIDALLRGQCQKSFYKELRMTERNQKYITMDGMFE